MSKKTAQKKKTEKTSVVKTKKVNIRKILKQWSIPLATVFVIALLVVAGRLFTPKQSNPTPQPEPTPVVTNNPKIIPLPRPDAKSSTSIEAALRQRRSKRNLLTDKLSQKQLGQVLWAAQGVTTDWGGRTAPSAKSTYPLTVYILVNNIDGLENGVYEYIPGDRLPAHQLVPIKLGDFGPTLHKDVNQGSLKDAPLVIVITGDMKKMADAFGGKPSDQMVYLEAGHAAQNVYLQVESLKLGTVVLGGFDPAPVANLLSIPTNKAIIYLIPVGYPKE